MGWLRLMLVFPVRAEKAQDQHVDRHHAGTSTYVLLASVGGHILVLALPSLPHNSLYYGGVGVTNKLKIRRLYRKKGKIGIS